MREAARRGRNVRILRPNDSNSSRLVHLPPEISGGGHRSLTEAEWQGFEFFRCHTAHELPGNFHSALWEQLVLQLSRREPAILHAAIAVGAMHRGCQGRSPSLVACRPEIPFALTEYTKALSRLRTRLVGSDDHQDCAEVALVACLLFICLEMLQGNRPGAIAHLRTGLRILAGSSRKVVVYGCQPGLASFSSTSALLDDHLSPVFGRLDYEATMFGEQSPSLSLTYPPRKQGDNPTLYSPQTFSNLSEARRYLDILASSLLYFRGELLNLATTYLKTSNWKTTDWATWHCLQHAHIKMVDLRQRSHLSARLDELKLALSQWFSAFKLLAASGTCKAAIHLEIQHFYLSFLLFTCRTTYEVDCDAYIAEFARIVFLARTFMADNDGPGLPTFTLESGILPSLYLISAKCRDPRIRREAIALLSRADCQEGMWEGPLFARFMEQVVALEEGAVCAATAGDGVEKAGDIPESARFCDVVLAATEEVGYGRLVCGRFDHGTGDGEFMISEKVFWAL